MGACVTAYRIEKINLSKDLNVAWFTRKYADDYRARRGLAEVGGSQDLDDLLLLAMAVGPRPERIGALYLSVGIEVSTIAYTWVAPQRRGQGLGRALCGMAEEVAREHRQSQMVVSTFDFQDGLRFWQKMGFRVYATLPETPDGAKFINLYKRVIP